MATMVVSRWTRLSGAFVLVAVIAFSFGSFYTAHGDHDDTSYHACLYAGSLSQVGTQEPANCGRGEPITLGAGLLPSQTNPTISGHVFINGITGEPDTPATIYGGGFQVIEHDDLHFSIVFPPGTSGDLMACAVTPWSNGPLDVIATLGVFQQFGDGSRSQDVHLSGDAYGFQFVCSEVLPT